MQRLHLFPDEDIPEDILKNLTEELPQPRKGPRCLDEYTQEEIETFPRVGLHLRIIGCRRKKISENNGVVLETPSSGQDEATAAF